jgi:hypothetical protein
MRGASEARPALGSTSGPAQARAGLADRASIEAPSPTQTPSVSASGLGPTGSRRQVPGRLAPRDTRAPRIAQPLGARMSRPDYVGNLLLCYPPIA